DYYCYSTDSSGNHLF
nr:immunoglobulin light chain junction region [Macaca mulatta]MOX17278.1 immunoglobulin light chain junction region [Macaca mulatta]MOX17789.1 immunoglobulin light chain junction region [Macaca mulatta]MOX17930.1 immunoglobulin light chain junction region [Macaca mulatta]MOX18226.1 immunoglobulin light chain junction region [Macaca mulatta]